MHVVDLPRSSALPPLILASSLLVGLRLASSNRSSDLSTSQSQKIDNLGRKKNKRLQGSNARSKINTDARAVSADPVPRPQARRYLLLAQSWFVSALFSSPGFPGAQPGSIARSLSLLVTNRFKIWPKCLKKELPSFWKWSFMFVLFCEWGARTFEN